MFGSLDLGIDLGTATILIHVRGKGIVLKEPSVVAMDRDSSAVLAVGSEAQQMIGRTPGNIVAVRPMRDGVIANYDVTEILLKRMIHKAVGRRFFKPSIAICAPSGVTTVERRAIVEAAFEAGAKRVALIEEPMAAAIGAGLNIAEPSGNMVVDVGGGTTDVAVISLGGMVVSDSIRIAGDKFDEAIVRYIKREYNMAIGERTAEEIKKEVGCAHPDLPVKICDVRGRDLVSGLPRNLTFSSREAYLALQEPVNAIIDTVKAVLEKTPPELAADIMEKGIVLTGGGALLTGLDRLIADVTGIPVHITEAPESCVAIGAGRIFEGTSGIQSAVFVEKKIS
ncbi:MAG: rod shape-determining protein [Firmicutes bacterium]|nr:rod shape-determining protein [Bacillota bacterium]